MKYAYKLLTVILALLTFSQLSAQTLNDRVIFVRFREGAVIVQDGAALNVNGRKIEIPNGSWKKAYATDPAKLDAYRRKASARLQKQLPDLNLNYRFIADEAADVQHIVDELNADPLVFSAKKAPMGVNASAPDYRNLQLYLNDHPVGINAEGVWTAYDNHGEGVRICDVEYTFNPLHSDLPAVTVIGPQPEDPFQEEIPGNHGTAVLGEIGALNDGIGVTGICYESDFFFAGAFFQNMYQLDAALLNAMDSLSAGDVVLIEQQVAGPMVADNQYGLVPVEWIKEYYDAIQVLVGNDIIVVEAAGNGSQDLDDPVYQQNNFFHYPFMPGNGSGAIIVGAGSTGTSDTQRASMWFTNYGSAVHVQGNGESIHTTGYGGLFSETYNEFYTATFGGTSGASPIVTGAVALMVSEFREQTGQTLTRDQILQAFLLTGQAQQAGEFTPEEKHIGPLPNVKLALDYLLEHMSVNEARSTTLIAYPNPSQGMVSVNCRPEQITAVTDISGNNVPFRSTELADGYSTVETSGLSTGIYFLTVKLESGPELVKISVQ